MKKIYEIDLDGTLCTNTDGAYGLAEPIYKNIYKVNKLYENGNIININTGRGSTTGIDWYDLTEAQLKEWGVKYHSLTCGKKPYYDVIIDDKAINAMKENWEDVQNDRQILGNRRLDSSNKRVCFQKIKCKRRL